MILTVNNGVLEKCVLAEKETKAIIPETVTKIAKDAFADNPYGKIREISFPDSLRYVHAEAFNPLAPLKSVSFYSYDQDDFHLYTETENGEKNEVSPVKPLRTEQLLIQEGKRGNTFVLTEWCEFCPEDIYVFAGADFRLIYNDDAPISSDLVHLKKLHIYGEGGSFTQDFIGRLFAYANCAKSADFLNTKIIGLNRQEGYFFEKRLGPKTSLNSRLRNFASAKELDENAEWKWQPVTSWDTGYGFEDAAYLEELILPEGLEAMHNRIIRCRKLKKLVIPPTVRSIGHSLRECDLLRSVMVDIHADGNLDVDSSSFYECPSLKTIILYEENARTGHRRAVERVDKTRWLKYHFNRKILNSFIDQNTDVWKRLFHRFDPSDAQENTPAGFEQRYAMQNEILNRIRRLARNDHGELSDEDRTAVREVCHLIEIAERALRFE